jgi:hypothetical protein
MLLMACQILNLSTDAIEFQPISTTNISEFNDLNTLTEYFSEIVLGHKNAFPESVNKKQHQSQLQKNMGIKLFHTISEEQVLPKAFLADLFSFPANENNTMNYVQEINPPPPKAA